MPTFFLTNARNEWYEFRPAGDTVRVRKKVGRVWHREWTLPLASARRCWRTLAVCGFRPW